MVLRISNNSIRKLSLEQELLQNRASLKHRSDGKDGLGKRPESHVCG